MTPLTRNFSFLTAAFPHGAYQSQGFNQPDLRGPSIKGQLRWWYDALFSNIKSEHGLFGYISSKENSRLGLEGNSASRVIVRVRPLEIEADPIQTEFMPHKGNDGGVKNAIPQGTTYEISLLCRREKLTGQEPQRLERVLDAWLLLGAVGQRANRGAGSVWPKQAPATSNEYLARAKAILMGSKLRCAVLSKSYRDERDLRYDAGDFIDGPVKSERRGSRDVEITEPWWPFGAAEDRKPSPLKLRAAVFDGQLRLVALWDGRHHTANDLRKGVERLAKQKEIGRLLLEALPELCS
jgi:CRISPR type III-B/RAMP module RAMP protein Cmr1